MNHYRIKYWLYKQDQWIISTLVLLLTGAIVVSIIDIVNNDKFINQVEFRAWVAIVAGLITLLFAFMRQKHNDMSVFFQLFEKYNQRYDKLNDFMNLVNEKTKDKQTGSDSPFEGLDGKYPAGLRKRLNSESTVKGGLDDYLNLCAEEYLAYSNGYIPPRIMEYWYNGMEIFFNNDHIRRYFRKELKSDSYYQFKTFALEKFDEIEEN
ncbi:MAG: hypothetical protein WD607_05400 [Candidatus Paceibacterota bacterium]